MTLRRWQGVTPSRRVERIHTAPKWKESTTAQNKTDEDDDDEDDDDDDDDDDDYDDDDDDDEYDAGKAIRFGVFWLPWLTTAASGSCRLKSAAAIDAEDAPATQHADESSRLRSADIC